jgi:hypothetical protein
LAAAWRTPQIDPELPYRIGELNGREVPESGPLSIVEGFGCAKSGHTHRRERGYELVPASSCCFHLEGDRPAMLAKNRVKALTSE